MQSDRCSWRRIPLALSFFSVLLNSFAVQTWHVSPSGSDTNPGSSSQPFREIRRALQDVAAGDEILIQDGSYLGFTLDSINGASNAPITLRAAGTNAVILKTTDRSDNRDTIFIVDSSYVTVDGLRSFGANRAALRIQGGEHVTVRNCVFGNNSTWGILTGHSPDLLIEFNECFGSETQHGIYVANSADRPVVRGNRCYNNYASGIQLNADVHTPPGDGIITGALIEKNVIFNNGRGGGGGLNLDGVQDSIIRNNLLFTNHASGIIFFQIDGAEGPRGNQILNNTIVQASDGRWALGIKQTTGTNIVRNNILLSRNTARGGLEFASAADAASTGTDYNLVNYVTLNEGDSRLTLAQWQIQGQDLHSRTGALASVFVNDVAGNFLLKTNSPAVDAALPLPLVGVDLDGLPRPFGPAPDIGCYEQSPLRLLWSERPGGLHLELSGGAGSIYQLQSSTNLSDWEPVLTATRMHHGIQLDLESVGSEKFFRAATDP